MSNPSKAKGTHAETAVVRWARENGFGGADRQPLRGNRDAGDVALCPGIVIEVKNHAGGAVGQPKPGLLHTWMAQASLECENAGAAMCPLVVKRGGTSDPGRWFAYITSAQFAWLVGAPIETLADPVAPWCTDLATLARLLRWHGYGDALPVPMLPAS